VSIAGALAPAGMLAFDTNSLATYRTSFSQVMVREIDELVFSWRGEASFSFGAGEQASATVDVFRKHASGLCPVPGFEQLL
jgi:hypothetical protein